MNGEIKYKNRNKNGVEILTFLWPAENRHCSTGRERAGEIRGMEEAVVDRDV
jgi:hypothetical protein